MARNGKKFWRRAKKVTIPLAVVAGFAAPAIKITEHWKLFGPSGAAREAGRIMTGVDFWTGQFSLQTMRFGLAPVLGGLAVHWLVGNKLGVNRMLSRAGIPFIRL